MRNSPVHSSLTQASTGAPLLEPPDISVHLTITLTDDDHYIINEPYSNNGPLVFNEETMPKLLSNIAQRVRHRKQEILRYQAQQFAMTTRAEKNPEQGG